MYEEDLNPNEQYGFHPVSDEWDFNVREEEMDKNHDEGLQYKSRVTLNLRKENPK